MKRRLSNQFLSHYLAVLALTLALTVLALGLLSFASGLISGTLMKNRYPAVALMRDDPAQIDSGAVVQAGGGVQIVDRDYRVVRSDGLDTLGKSSLSAQEFTDFLTGSKRIGIPYHYDIAYNPLGEFWLIVTFPTSLRIDFAVAVGRAAAAGDWARAAGVAVGVGLLFLLLLAAVAFLYSRITAAKITRPLAKLCDGTRLLREGDYSVRVDLRLKNEFAQLQDTFNAMAEKIQQEMALRKKSEEDRRRLILDISHDLKTPLASISGYGELCLGKPDLSPQEREKYLGVILTNSQRANRLLGELFELSQLDSPGFALRQEPTDLGEALRQACAEMIPALEEAGFDYDFEIPQEEIWVRLDVHRFQRIVQNLADNALRYNPKGTKVTVSLRQEGQEARVLFEDNGRGIPPLLAREIFKPFIRAEESRNSDSGGSGLGLSIARSIARAHGGDLTLDSDEGRGSRFLLSLPLM